MMGLRPDDFPTVSDNPEMNVEISGDAMAGQIPQLTPIDEHYKNVFYEAEHMNFIAMPSKHAQNRAIICVLSKPLGDQLYRVLLFTKKGYELIELEIPASKGLFGPKTEVERVLKGLSEGLFPELDIYYVPDPDFRNELLTLEARSPEKSTCFRMGVVFCKREQTDEADMFANEVTTQAFDDFLDVLGDKIELLGFKGYRGQLSVTSPGKSVFTKWNGIEIMFHVCPYLNPEQQRRLVGNDTALIYFHQGDDRPFQGEAPRSGMTQLFAVVQPRTDRFYKLAFMSRKRVPAHPPTLPENPVFPVHDLDGKRRFKDFLLTKLINGYRSATKCPPLDKMFKRPRFVQIQNLTRAFPFDGKKSHIVRGSKKKRKK